MKKRAISLFLVVSISFTLFYPELSLNDNVLECVDEDETECGEISLSEFLRMPRTEKKYKLRLLEWFNEICK